MSKNGFFKIGIIGVPDNCVVQHTSIFGKKTVMAPGLKFVFGTIKTRNMSDIKDLRFKNITFNNDYAQEIGFNVDLSYKFAGGTKPLDSDSREYNNDVKEYDFYDKLLDEDLWIFDDNKNNQFDENLSRAQYIKKQKKEWKENHPVLEYDNNEDNILGNSDEPNIVETILKNAAEYVYKPFSYSKLSEMNNNDENAELFKKIVTIKLLKIGLKLTDLKIKNIVLNKENVEPKEELEEDFEYDEEIDEYEDEIDNNEEIDTYGVLNDNQMVYRLTRKRNKSVIELSKEDMGLDNPFETMMSNILEGKEEVKKENIIEKKEVEEIMSDEAKDNNIPEELEELVFAELEFKDKEDTDKSLEDKEIEEKISKLSVPAAVENNIPVIPIVDDNHTDNSLEMLKKVEELDTKYASAIKEVSNLNQENDELAKELIASEMEKTDLESKKTELLVYTDELENEVTKQEKQNEELNQENDELTEKLVLTKTENNDLARRKTELLVYTDELENEYYKQEKENEELSQELLLAEIDNEQLVKQLDEIEAKLSASEAENSGLKADVTNLQEELEELKEKYNSSIKNNTYLSERVVKLEGEITILTDEKNEDKEEEKQEFIRRINVLEVDNEDLTTENEGLKEELADTKTELAESSSKVAKLLVEKDEADNTILDLRKKNEKLSGLYSRVIAEKHNLKGKVAELENNKEKDQIIGSYVSTCADLTDENNALRSSLISVKEEAKKTIAENQTKDIKIAELNTSLDSQDAVIEELKNKIALLEKTNEELVEGLKEAEEDKKKANDKVNKLEKDIIKLNNENEKLAQSEKDLKLKNAESEKEKVKLEIKNKDLSDEVKDLSNQVITLEGEKKALETEVKAKDDANKDLKEVINKIENKPKEEKAKPITIKIYKLCVERTVLIKCNGMKKMYDVVYNAEIMHYDEKNTIDEIIDHEIRKSIKQKVKGTADETIDVYDREKVMIMKKGSN